MDMSGFVKAIEEVDILTGSQFFVEINAGKTGLDFGWAAFLAKAANIPPITLGTFETYVQASSIAMPNRIDNGTVDITFWNNGETYKSFVDWIEKVYDPDKRCLNYLEEYAGTVSIIQISRNGDEVIKHTYYVAYPKTVGELALDWGNSDQLQEFTVTFVFADFEKQVMEIVTTSPKNGIPLVWKDGTSGHDVPAGTGNRQDGWLGTAGQLALPKKDAVPLPEIGAGTSDNVVVGGVRQDGYQLGTIAQPEADPPRPTYIDWGDGTYGVLDFSAAREAANR